MLALIGITGQTGSAAAATLLRQGHRLRALVRDPARAAAWATQGVELEAGDVTDPGALRQTFDGAEAAYVMIPPAPTHPDPVAYYAEVATAVREAARAAGLGRLVLLSSEGAHLASGTGPILGLHRAEAILADAAPHVTRLRPSYFQENWRSVFDLAATQGILPTMLAELEARRPMVATADIGRVAAELLTDPDAPSLVELSGPDEYSARDAAAAVGKALGREVVPVQPPRAAWEGILREAGLGDAYARLIAEMYDGINSGHIRFSGQGERRRGRVTLDETVAAWARLKVPA
ncbi:NmrA family NAD(P)-binding protein [Falsiroseomonas oryzae]|uniref:NmrA family NAD(P)-binding protein n=1 Tax=Falsiroseomonas oryzae TaxID=2766473 RepID=UPI0022EA19FA|nr:NAD(P)H-binding protein [Roseomonas sp. MO-31]